MYSLADSRTTIGVKPATKARLNKNRAPGQCYDGFLCQLVEMWEEAYADRLPVNNRLSSIQTRLRLQGGAYYNSIDRQRTQA